jgi:CDP-diacylglycerol--glycerol-3-phosphate 3-phosphatidyltransferase
MANALTGIRLLLAIPFAILMAKEDALSAILALFIWLAALLTDLMDGPIARQRGTVTAFSGTFDHASDFLFVTAGLTGGAVRGAFPWILPLLVAGAFAQYVIDSYWVHRHIRLRASQLGRYNGILYFVPPCADILIRVGLTFLQPLLTVFVWLLVASTAVSMAQRLTIRGLPKQLPSCPPEK